MLDYIWQGLALDGQQSALFDCWFNRVVQENQPKSQRENDIIAR